MKRLTATVIIVLTAAALPQWMPQARVQASRSRQESLAIIVNESNPINDLSLPELRAVFLGERTHWPNGRRITLVLMEPGPPERDVVLREIWNMGAADLRGRLLQGLLTGEILVSPKTLATPVGVRKFVFNVPGAIGYLRPAEVDGSVKILRIGGRLPGDAEYPLVIPERATP